MSKSIERLLGLSCTMAFTALFALLASSTSAYSQDGEIKSCGELAGGVKICEPWLYDECQQHSQCYVE